jgi:hypothetical protein
MEKVVERGLGEGADGDQAFAQTAAMRGLMLQRAGDVIDCNQLAPNEQVA